VLSPETGRRLLPVHVDEDKYFIKKIIFGYGGVGA